MHSGTATKMCPPKKKEKKKVSSLFCMSCIPQSIFLLIPDFKVVFLKIVNSIPLLFSFPLSI